MSKVDSMDEMERIFNTFEFIFILDSGCLPFIIDMTKKDKIHPDLKVFGLEKHLIYTRYLMSSLLL